MPSPSLLRLLAPAAALLACACGGATATSPTCPPPPSAPVTTPRATVGAVTLSASSGVVPRGASLALTAVAAGPLQLAAPCSGPVTLVVSDPAGLHVTSDSPPAPPGTPCGDLALTAGQQAVFHAVWTVDPTLPSGAYEVTLTVGDQPEVSLRISVGGGVGGAPAC